MLALPRRLSNLGILIRLITPGRKFASFLLSIYACMYVFVYLFCYVILSLGLYVMRDCMDDFVSVLVSIFISVYRITTFGWGFFDFDFCSKFNASKFKLSVFTFIFGYCCTPPLFPIPCPL